MAFIPLHVNTAGELTAPGIVAEEGGHFTDSGRPLAF